VALLTCDFFSEALGTGTSVTVVLPQATTGQIGVAGGGGPDAEPPPLLYLLHGLSDDHTAWLRYTSIERYAAAAGLAVVMPAAGRSFYRDEPAGLAYGAYLGEELPQLVASFLRVTDRPDRTFVAGLSMGGYGALRLALTHPGRYAAAASMSGGLDVVTLSRLPDRLEVLGRIFPGGPTPDDDLHHLLAQAEPGSLPPLHLSCGTEDPLLPFTVDFAERAMAAGADVTTDYRAGGHEWGLWDEVVRDVIAWLPLASGA
jgi:putative tributyrin esterase